MYLYTWVNPAYTCHHLLVEYFPIFAGSAGASMNEARLSHLLFWGPSEGFFLIN